jgi:hypothetical protein
MKRIILLVFAYQSCCFLFSQNIDFAPVGTKWWVNQMRLDHQGIPQDSFIIVEVTGEEVKEGRLCRVISNLTGIGLPLTAHVYTDNDSVFFYSEVTEQFELLYDFSAAVGSQWTIKGLSEIADEFNVTVTDVTYEEIDGEQLKVWFITHNQNSNYWSNKIIERIGNTHFLAPTFTGLDTIENGKLPAANIRCYSDSVLFVKLYEIDCDGVYGFSSVNETDVSKFISVFPNPAHDFIQIEIPLGLRNDQLSYIIFDLLGNPLLQGFLSENITVLEISNLGLSGVFNISIKDTRTGAIVDSKKLIIID